MPSKKQVLEMLKQVKSGKITIGDLQTAMESTRKMEMLEESNIKSVKELSSNKAYFVRNGKLFSLPLQKTRTNGKKAIFVPYYRTATE